MDAKNILRTYIKKVISEEFDIVSNKLELKEPYDKVEVVEISGRKVYILFGNVDYYNNKQAILAIKRKSTELSLNNKSYEDFLQEFKRRFYSIGELKTTDLLVSVETTCPVTSEMASKLNIPFIKNGFKKIDPSFKMRDINDFSQRLNIDNLFNLDFELKNNETICVVDDFITSGSTFKNAFDKLPPGTKAFGVCLFKLNS